MEVVLASTLHATEKQTIEVDKGKDLYPEIQKVSNDFYQARMPGKNLWLVMERVDHSTVPLWRQYGLVQSDAKGYNHSGSGHFYGVLTKTSYEGNEIWVAYITKAEKPEKIPGTIKYYKVEDLETEKGRPFTKDIEMFVTVTSNPNALITSNMGISASVEAQMRKRTKGISGDLLSFTAKVMLMRNPERKFMVNAPTYQMIKIISDACPGGVFIGTREMQQTMEEKKKVTFEEFSAQNEKVEYEEVMKLAEEDCKRENSNLERDIQKGSELGKSEEDIREKAIKKTKDTLLEMGKDGKFVVSEQKVELFIQKEMKDKFIDFKNPYIFPFIKDFENLYMYREGSTEKFEELWKKQPPLLSITQGRTGIENFKVYNPQNPSGVWLDVDKSNADYQWMFTDPFWAGAGTYYIVVDLKALADSKKVE